MRSWRTANNKRRAIRLKEGGLFTLQRHPQRIAWIDLPQSPGDVLASLQAMMDRMNGITGINCLFVDDQRVL